MTTHLALQRILLPSAQVSSLTTGSITLPSARGAFTDGQFESIATTTLSSSNTVITFSNIPQTYYALRLSGITRYDNNGISQLAVFQFNGDTGSNYNYWVMRGEGHTGSVTGGGAVNQTSIPYPHGPGSTASSNNFSAFILDIVDYTLTSKYKSTKMLNGFATNGGSEEQLHMTTGLWKSTSAITSISFSCSSQNMVANTTIALYGLKGD
jgi:hypothetical protein